jgi:hypothetical protein
MNLKFEQWTNKQQAGMPEQHQQQRSQQPARP